MGMLISAGKENLGLLNIFKNIKYRIQFAREHPDYFDPDGLLIFVNGQGSGKTISAVNYVYKLMELYPKAKLVTNVFLEKYPIVSFVSYCDNYSFVMTALEYTTLDNNQKYELMYNQYLKENRVFEFLDNDDFIKYENGECGVIFFVDEIQLYMNSLESKNVNLEVVTELSQQRKQRKHIVASSQYFGRMAKPLREQFSSIISCRCLFKMLQINKLIDKDSLDTEQTSDAKVTGKVKKTFVWFHSPAMYKRYDTYQKIKKGKFASGENQKGGIFDAGSNKLPISN